MKRFFNYKDYVIATSVIASEGRPFEASFFVGRKVTDSEDEIVHTERLARTFAYRADARAAAQQAAQAYVDSHPQD